MSGKNKEPGNEAFVELLLWEKQLNTKLINMSKIGIINMILASVVFVSLCFNSFLLETGASILVFILIIFLAGKNKYISAAYVFFIAGFIFLLVMSIKLGKGSYLILFYFPVIIGMVQLLGRKETMKHLVLLSSLCLTTIFLISVVYYYDWLVPEVSPNDDGLLAVMNIVLSFATTIVFTLSVVKDFIRQEQLIKKMLEDKNLLLAEVFHRVKNNLNVVTSLLNLQKNTSTSDEVRNALEECRNRIYSMALVHENIFNHKEIGLDFNKYISRLVKDIEMSFGVDGETIIELQTEEVILDLEQAVPCGLILNELLTNAHKYARVVGRPLIIKITLQREAEHILFSVRDNGPGLPEGAIDRKDSLGFSLIESLCEQLNGSCTASNKDGLVFTMCF